MMTGAEALVQSLVREGVDVVFAYPEEDVTLNKFNLTIEPNKKIAIVGKSGQGKSTLFNLMTRIFDPIEGEILIDGVNIKDLTENSLRKNISIIRQEPFIFNRTIKENFKLIDARIPLATIRKYTKLAYLDDYISSLPKKYDTLLGESGVNLSGGQRQRLAIARAFIQETEIILFDEATSALDSASEREIQKAIDYLTRDRTRRPPVPRPDDSPAQIRSCGQAQCGVPWETPAQASARSRRYWHCRPQRFLLLWNGAPHRGGTRGASSLRSN